MRFGWQLFGLAILTIQAQAGPVVELPVYFEESHAGSFYFFASTLPLDQPHTLILVDAHTDASAVAGSDEIREAIRRGPTREAQAVLFQTWRESGKIQCYNWLEPLMPAPFSEVLLILAPLLPKPQQDRMQEDARNQLDAHEEAVPREAGALGPRYRATDLRGLEQETGLRDPDRAVVASIDLDYFANLPEGQWPTAMDQLLDPILELPGLRALSFCLSLPWQKSPEHAERLTVLALDAVFRIPRARLQFEPLARCGPDRSLRAGEIAEAGGTVPVFDLAGSSPALRSLLAVHWRQEMTRTQPAEAAREIGAFRQDVFLPRVEVSGKLASAQGDWPLDPAELDTLLLSVLREPVGAVVRWEAIRPAGPRSRVMDGPWSYGEGAPRWLRWKTEPLGTGRTLSLTKLRPLLHPVLMCGTVKVRVVVEREGVPRFSAPVVLTVKAPGTGGFREALSRQAGLPYIFGSTFLTDTAPDGTRRSGADCGEGADCANFLSAAFRAGGWRTRQGSVSDFAASLSLLPTPDLFPPDAVERGLILDFGPHAAALWEDRPPLGKLNDSDLCVHQLEGFPEWLELGKLRQGRPAPRLLERGRSGDVAARVVFGGDVMLARTVGGRLAAGGTVSGWDPAWFSGALGIVNLECAIPAGKSGGFSAPPAAVRFLREAGFKAVSVANNHSRDAGPAGLDDTVKALSRAGLGVFGHDARPHRLAIPDSLEMSLFGWNETGPVSATALAARVRRAGFPVVFAHWGLEHSRIPNDDQRRAARVFIEAGARIIVGSGPHAVQPLEWVEGVPVAWSLGNLVFDGAGPDAAWRRGALLELRLSPTGQIQRAALQEVPVAGGP